MIKIHDRWKSVQSRAIEHVQFAYERKTKYIYFTQFFGLPQIEYLFFQTMHILFDSQQKVLCKHNVNFTRSAQRLAQI